MQKQEKIAGVSKERLERRKGKGGQAGEELCQAGRALLSCRLCRARLADFPSSCRGWSRKFCPALPSFHPESLDCLGRS